MVSFTQVVGLICEEVACNSIATMADLAAADLEEIQQGTSEATREERLQGRIARIAEAQTQLEHDRKALAQAESDAAVARSESDLKKAEDQIAKEQAAIKARFAEIAEEQVARDEKRASGAQSAAALQVIKENAAAENDMLLEAQIGRFEDILERLKKRLIPTDEVVGYVEEIELSAEAEFVAELARQGCSRTMEGLSAAPTAAETSIVAALDVQVQVSEILALVPKPIIPRRLSTGAIPDDHSIQSSFFKNCVGEMGDAVMGLIDGTDMAITRMAYEYSQLLAMKMQVPMEVRMALFRRIGADSGSIIGTPGKAFILAATRRIRAVEREIVGGLLVGNARLVPSVQALVRQSDRDGNDNAIRKIYAMFLLQVVPKAPPLQDARLAVQNVKDYHPKPSSTVGALGAAVELRRSMIRTAEAAALAAGASTGFSLDSAKQQLEFVAEQLTLLDVDGQQALNRVRSDLIMARLDERSMIEVDKNIDRIVVVVEAERAMRLASRGSMSGGGHGTGSDTKAAELKAAEAKVSAAQAAEVKTAEAKVAEAKAVKAKAKVDAEARAAMAAAAAGIRANAAVAAIFPGTCFNCGVVGHRKSECTAAGRCARCQRPGHAARVCTAPAPVSP